MDRVYYRHLGYERVYLPLCKVADTPFHIQDEYIGPPCMTWDSRLTLIIILERQVQ